MQPIEGYTDEQLIDAFLAEKKKHRMTQTKAAEAAGVAQATVSEWTRGQRRPLQPETRKALESYLRAQRGSPPPDEREDDWTLILRAADRRAHAFEELAVAERIYAEAAKARSEAVASQARTAERDSQRSWEGKLATAPRFGIRDLLGADAEKVIALFQDLAEELRLRRGGGGEGPQGQRAAG